MSDEVKTDRYVLENDSEVARLAAQHAMLKYNFNGQLIWPEILEDLQRRPSIEVLESGTANGLWMRDLADSLPNATFVGTDITTSFFPKTHTDRFTYEVQDVLQPWPSKYQNRFDLVHQRLVLTVMRNRKDVNDIVARLADTVKPVGWIQLLESDFSDDLLPETNGPAFRQFTKLLTAFSPDGQAFCRTLKPILSELRFENVQEVLRMVPIGGACGDREIGMSFSKLFHYASLGFASAAKGKGIIDDKELETLPERVAKELEVQGAHIANRIVWGRRSKA